MLEVSLYMILKEIMINIYFYAVSDFSLFIVLFLYHTLKWSKDYIKSFELTM